MRSIKTYLIITFALLGITLLYPAANLIAKEKDNPDNYTIRIDNKNPGVAHIECNLQIQDSLLYMSPVGANQFDSRWARFVHGLKAEGPDGKTIRLDSLDGARWTIHSPKGSRAKLIYEVHLEHENFSWSGGVDGAAYQRDWGVFYTGRSLFIMNGGEKESIEVGFEIPENWKISTPWEPTDTDRHSFKVDNLSSLSNGMLFAGTHEEFVVKRQDFELVFAFGGSEITKQKESFKNMAEGVLDYYINLMGGVPNPSPDDKFSKAIVVLNPSVQTDGEVIGNNISILLEEGGDAMSQMIARFIFAHEFFHLWNGKSFTPENDDCEWFKEGFTNYYTLKALYHIGFLNQQSFLGVLNSFFYQRYDKDPGVGSISMTQGDQKHDHWGLIYSGGFFAGISQDMIIRSITENNKSIDDVMRILFVKYGGTDNAYTLTELEKLFSEASGEDQSDFFKSYIKGNSRIPLANYLNMAGFTAAEEEGQLRVSVKEELSPVEEKIIEGFLGKL